MFWGGFWGFVLGGFGMGGCLGGFCWLVLGAGFGGWLVFGTYLCFCFLGLVGGFVCFDWFLFWSLLGFCFVC